MYKIAHVTATTAAFSGLELLSSAVVLLDQQRIVRYINPSAENLFAVSLHRLRGKDLSQLLGEHGELNTLLTKTQQTQWSYSARDLCVRRPPGPPLQLDCTISPAEINDISLLLEFRPIDSQLRITREEQLRQQQQACRELVRNLAHEIKNPLGGIRGSAQLLERELDRPALREYTSVIIAEADRLQDLMNRMLSAHRLMQRPTRVNIHDVLEHVRRLIEAEFPNIVLLRDYDISLPEINADREQLIQAVLNICRNGAQALQGQGKICLRTTVMRQVTLAKRRHKLVLALQIIDNGPGIPADFLSKIFYPLVSGREGGSGLGLSLAQSFIEQHHGIIEVASRQAHTCFTILLPIPTPA